MLNIKDYVQLDCMGEFEFGLALTSGEYSPVIKVVVVDHSQFMVRTLGTAYALEDAFSIAVDCIQTGFYVDGLAFRGIQGYSFSPTTTIASGR